jgi:hypothetical protein
MKLQKSKLCVNCESIYEQHAPCPYCGSEIFVWLSRALGTTIAEDGEEMKGCGGEAQVRLAARAPADGLRASGSTFGTILKESLPFTEFRLACGRVGREMVKVLTLGFVQAFK